MGVRKNIKRLCNEKGISVSALEQELGYGNGALKKSDNIKLERLTELSNYFNVSLAELAKEDDVDIEYNINDLFVHIEHSYPEAAQRKAKRLMHYYSKICNLTEPQQELIFQMIDQMEK